ncbi:delta-1-pyrroline-5-carboxylate dehydrogenase, mitochondrial, partial [Elysia marginata]
GKNVFQAEIDATAELIDFLRFNVQFAQRSTSYQPISTDPKVTLNSMVYRGMEGFWAAVCPFNFAAIGGNLPMAPALMGNAVLWKPSDTAVLSNYEAFKIYREAGLPPGVINFVPADGPTFGDTITASPHLAGINFTGSAATFKRLWRQVGENLDNYINFPRMIGECGGKNMHFVHPSADLENVANGTVRSAFEYNGQKCSACSRLYVPESMWPKLKERLLSILSEVKMGSPLDRQNLVTAVIDAKAFARTKSYIDYAKSSPHLTILTGGNYDDSVGYFVEPTVIVTSDPSDKLMAEAFTRTKSYIDYAKSCPHLTILTGGNYDDSVGYFVEPTVIVTTDPSDKLMAEEIFAPVLTVYVYPDSKVKETVELSKNTSPFALTGAIYVQDEVAKAELAEAFRFNAGNFYINDKSTGSIVGQQPFGGSRQSGTNDKAGGPFYMTRFMSPQAVKETFVPLKDWRYPSLEK